MVDETNTSQDEHVDAEGTTTGDPNIGETGMDKLLLRVEGQNENITTPPKEVEADVANTARDIDDLTMGIEDESGA